MAKKTNSEPAITVIIPTFNESGRIRHCLESVRNQDYSQENIYIFLIDDNSTDNTLEIAKRYNVEIFLNGTHHIERAKSIGVDNSKTEYLFFMDADNALTNSNWFKESVHILEEHPEVVGVQSQRFLYKKNDNIANRYCELFGINDPYAYYIGKRGLLKATEDSWIYPDSVQEIRKNFFIVEFDKDTLPTLGSQGYMTRKSLVIKSDWKPYLFHMDSIYDLVVKRKRKFAIIRYDIEHDYVVSICNMYQKWRRNIQLYYKYSANRRYKYNLNPKTFLKTTLILATFIIPLKDGMQGFIKKPDVAWLMHPFFCFMVVLIYSYCTVEFYVKKLFWSFFH